MIVLVWLAYGVAAVCGLLAMGLFGSGRFGTGPVSLRDILLGLLSFAGMLAAVVLAERLQSAISPTA